MTWSPFRTEVTPAPTSTTTPAPSWPRIAGNRPSGSAPDRVNSSVWQMPVALISSSTSKAFGPSSCTVITSSGLPGATATAARTSMCQVSLTLLVALSDHSAGVAAMNQRFKAVRTDCELECSEIDAGLRALGCDLVLLPDGSSEDDLILAMRE